MKTARMHLEKCKERLTNNSVLTHYESNKTLILAIEASPYGVEAFIRREVEDQNDHPSQLIDSICSVREDCGVPDPIKLSQSPHKET